MTAVNFREHRYMTRTPEFTLEEVMRRFLAYSGNHYFSFDSLYNADEVTWAGNPDIILQSGSSVTLEGIASGTDFIYADFPVPSNHMISYTTAETTHGALLAYQDSSGDGVGYEVKITPSVITIHKRQGATKTLRISVPTPADIGPKFSYVFRQYSFSDSKTEVWNFITVYSDATEILSWGDVHGLSRSGCVVGLLSHNTDTTAYTDFWIREFCETAEWGTADPGENPIAGLQRVLEGRYIRFWLRATGEFRAWRPHSIDSVHAITGEHDYRALSEESDFTSMATHIRMVGAYLWAEYIDPEGIDMYGYKFVEDDNPMLFTEEECYIEAGKQYKRRLETAITSTIAVQSKPFLEIDDRITIDGADYMVSGISFNVGPGSVVGQLALRKYVWG